MVKHSRKRKHSKSSSTRRFRGGAKRQRIEENIPENINLNSNVDYEDPDFIDNILAKFSDFLEKLEDITENLRKKGKDTSDIDVYKQGVAFKLMGIFGAKDKGMNIEKNSDDPFGDELANLMSKIGL